MIHRSFGLLCDETSAVERVLDMLTTLWVEMRIGDEFGEWMEELVSQRYEFGDG